MSKSILKVRRLGIARSRRCAGFTVMELLVTMSILALTLFVSMPNLIDFYRAHQTAAAATRLQGLVQFARMSALKEKTRYRIVIKDQGDVQPNRFEIEREQSGAFVVVTGEIHEIPDGVTVLGGTGTDSINNMTVSARGECESGKVFLRGKNDAIEVVSIESTCTTAVSGG